MNRPIGDNRCLGFVRPSRRLDEGDEFNFGTHKLKIKKKLEFGEIEIEFCLNELDLFDFLDQYGQVPLPQYIKRESKEEDVQRYQNVYSQPKGSVAAATAGLHFSHDLIEKIVAKNIEMAFVRIHVGAGTFLPVKIENIADHKMHSEWCEVSQETADKINSAKKDSRRVIVVGTTAMRTLKSCSENNIVFAGAKESSIFITPGYKFQIADILITNFHSSKSTLFMLVCAFAGYEEMKNIYKYAIDNKMRFFSYGDAMMIEKKISNDMTNMIGETDNSNFLNARDQFEKYRKNIVKDQEAEFKRLKESNSSVRIYL